MRADDRLALSDLVHRYAAAVDDRQAAAVAALFTQDGVLVTADPPTALDPVLEHVGKAAIELAMDQLVLVPQTFHAIVGEVYTRTAVTDLAVPRAKGRIACVAHHVIDATTDLVWHLRYLDDYCVSESGWRISRRGLWIDLIETRPIRRARSGSSDGR